MENFDLEKAGTLTRIHHEYPHNFRRFGRVVHLRRTRQYSLRSGHPGNRLRMHMSIRCRHFDRCLRSRMDLWRNNRFHHNCLLKINYFFKISIQDCLGECLGNMKVNHMLFINKVVRTSFVLVVKKTRVLSERRIQFLATAWRRCASGQKVKN